MPQEDFPLPPGLLDDEAYVEKRVRTYILGFAVETLSLLLVGAVVITFAVLAFVIDIDIRELERLGYVGVFLITFAGAASIVVPMPGLAATAGGGAVLDPVMDIPAPVMVGLVAGLGEAIGEFTGYGMGFGGTPIFERRRAYRLFRGLMERYGMFALFMLAVIPNILFDLAGVAAGASRMKIWKFFVAVLVGKTIKSMYIAGAGALIAKWFF